MKSDLDSYSRVEHIQSLDWMVRRSTLIPVDSINHLTKITDELLVAAADAIASCVAPAQLNANFIIPSVFDAEVAKKVAAAVKEAAK